VSRQVQAFVLVMLGTVLVRLAVTGDYLNYVRPGLGSYLIAAGAFLVALGLIGVVRDVRSGADAEQAQERRRAAARRRTHGPGADTAPPEHEHDGWYAHGSGWLLCLPLFVLLVLPPPALGSYAAGRSGAAAPAPAGRTSYPALTSQPATLALRDYAMRAVWDHGRTLSGHTVVLTGFVAASPGDLWYLTRLHVVCCAADATPAKVEVLGSTIRYPTSQWVSVTGTWIPSDPHDLGGTVARIEATTVTAIPRPEDPYE
jgi:uncharacterized repeat protein (TIGR03943 family)